MAALGYVTVAFATVFELPLSLGAIALSYLCVWGHIVDDLNNQNVSLLLWALTAWALVRISQDRIRTAGAALAVGASLKVMPGFALLGLLASDTARRWRLIMGAALGIAGALLVTWATMGTALFFDATRFWLDRIVSHAGVRDAALSAYWGNGNRGWAGLGLRLLRGASPQAQHLAVVSAQAAGLVLLTAIVVMALMRPAKSFRGIALDAVLVSVAGVLMLPLMWSHYLTICMPIALAVCASWHGLRRGERTATAALLSTGAILSCFFNIDIVGRRVWDFVDARSSTLWGTLLILSAGLVLRGAWRRDDEVRNGREGAPRIAGVLQLSTRSVTAREGRGRTPSSRSQPR